MKIFVAGGTGAIGRPRMAPCVCSMAECSTTATGEDALKASGADAVYYGTQMRGVSNAKAKRELNFQPRPLEWIVETAVGHAGQKSV